jgi:hypothetical protein
MAKKIKKDGYYGGGANQPHVHVYGASAHLKLGRHRYNLVQDGKKYTSAIKDAYDALEDHPLGADLKEWVDAAIDHLT